MKKYEIRGYITSETINLMSEMLKDENDLLVEVTSVGGSFFAATAMAAMMRDSKKSITMHVQGLAASAASYLLTASTRATADRDAMIMLHNARLTVFDELSEEKAESISEQLERVNDILAKSYARVIKSMTLDEIKDKLKSDWWLTAQEALELGLIAEITEAQGAGIRNMYAIGASLVNSFDSTEATSIFCELPNHNQPRQTMKDLDKLIATLGVSSADGILDAVSNVIRERDTVQAQLQSKSELVTQLTNKQSELETALASAQEKLELSSVTAKVDEIVKNANVIVSDEVRSAIERRVSNAMKIKDEAIKADILADAAIYAKMNGVAPSGPAGSTPDRKPNVAGASYDERLHAKVIELKNAGVALDEAYKQARKLVKDKEA